MYINHTSAIVAIYESSPGVFILARYYFAFYVFVAHHARIIIIIIIIICVY